MQKVLYWGVLAILLVGGEVISLCGLLPVVNSVIFLLGLLWAWKGVSLVMNVNVGPPRNFSRRAQIVSGALCAGMGLAWTAISLSPLSDRGLPMLAVTLPFLLPMAVVYFYSQKRPAEK